MSGKSNKTKTEMVYGVNPLCELLKAKRRKLVVLYATKQKPKAWSKINQLLPRYPYQLIHKSRAELTQLAGTSDHQSLVAFAQPFVYRSKAFDARTHTFLLMLDGIQDVRNLGAILRSAYCTGVTGVIISAKNSAQVTAVTLKASAGYAEHMDIMRSSSLVSSAKDLIKQNYGVYVATFGGKSALEVSYANNTCIVIGAEGKGVSAELASVGTKVSLPQRKHGISYNASVAAGILLFLAAFKKA